MSCQDVCLPEDAEMRILAEALGAVAAGPAATFWLYADSDGRWHVRRDGEAEDHPFDQRDEARAIGERARTTVAERLSVAAAGQRMAERLAIIRKAHG